MNNPIYYITTNNTLFRMLYSKLLNVTSSLNIYTKAK